MMQQPTEYTTQLNTVFFLRKRRRLREDDDGRDHDDDDDGDGDAKDRLARRACVLCTDGRAARCRRVGGSASREWDRCAERCCCCCHCRLRRTFATVTLPNQRNPIHSLGKPSIASYNEMQWEAVTRNGKLWIRVQRTWCVIVWYDMFGATVVAATAAASSCALACTCDVNAKNEWHCRRSLCISFHFAVASVAMWFASESFLACRGIVERALYRLYRLVCARTRSGWSVRWRVLSVFSTKLNQIPYES